MIRRNRNKRSRGEGYTHDGRIAGALFILMFLAAIYGGVSWMAGVTKNADAHMAQSLEHSEGMLP